MIASILTNLLFFGNRETILYIAETEKEAENVFYEVRKELEFFSNRMNDLFFEPLGTQKVELIQVTKNPKKMKMSHGATIRFITQGSNGCGLSADMIVCPNMRKFTKENLDCVQVLFHGDAHRPTPPIIISGGY